jgi:dephospho-CoA kinase
MEEENKAKASSENLPEEPEIIGVTGLPFSGKSTLAEIAGDKGFERFRMGDAIVEEMKERDIEVTNENIREFATKLREEEGQSIAADLSIPSIEDILDEGNKVVIDGIRSPEEISKFKEYFGDDMILKSIHAPTQQRFQRAMNRNREDDFEDYEDFKWNDQKQLEWGLDETIEQADIKISNDSDLEEFRERVEKVLNKLSN